MLAETAHARRLGIAAARSERPIAQDCMPRRRLGRPTNRRTTRVTMLTTLMVILALSLAPLVLAAQPTTPDVGRGPDFAQYMSSDQAIVVSIHTTRTRR